MTEEQVQNIIKVASAGFVQHLANAGVPQAHILKLASAYVAPNGFLARRDAMMKQATAHIGNKLAIVRALNAQG